MASALTVLFLGCCLAGQSRAREQGSPKNGNKQTDSKQRAEGPSPKPSISASPGGVIPVKGNVTIRCCTEQLGMRFLLYKDGAEKYLNYTDPAGSEAEFRIFIISREDGGNYTCRYSNKAGAAPYSVSSDPVQIMVQDAGSTSAEGTDRTQRETPSAPSPSARDAASTPTSGTRQTQRETTSALSSSATDAGSTPTRGPISGQSGSEPNGAIVAGVIVGAAGLLLLLLLGFLCRRRTRAREGPASRQSRESEAATTVYALAGLGKQQDVPKPDPGAEGLTYTELDRQVLQAKQDARVPAPEPVLYATVSRSQGAPQPPP